MATLILGVLMVAALQTLGSAGLGRAKTTDRAVARALADALLTEIMAQAYQDPGTSPLFGLEPGETLSPRTCNDADDYNGLSELPPRDAAGATIAGASGLQRLAKVEWVSEADLSTVSATETGVKRITVTVSRAGVPLARRVAIRTRAG